MSELLAGQKDHGQVDDEASVEVQISSKEEEQDVGNGKSAKRGHRRNLSMQVGELLMSEKDAAAKLGISVTYDEEKAKAKAMAVEVETTQGDVDESGEAQNSEESGKAVSNASGIKVPSSRRQKYSQWAQLRRQSQSINLYKSKTLLDRSDHFSSCKHLLLPLVSCHKTCLYHCLET